MRVGFKMRISVGLPSLSQSATRNTLPTWSHGDSAIISAERCVQQFMSRRAHDRSLQRLNLKYVCLSQSGFIIALHIEWRSLIEEWRRCYKTQGAN